MRASLLSSFNGLTAGALAVVTGCGHVVVESNDAGDGTTTTSTVGACIDGEPATTTSIPAGPECASLVPIVGPMSPAISVGYQPVYAGANLAVAGSRLGIVNVYDVDEPVGPGENPPRVVEFHLVSADGELLLEEPLRLAFGQVGGLVTWTGQDFAVALSTKVEMWNQDVSFQRVSAVGQKVGSTTDLVTGPSYTDPAPLASNGCGLALAWDDWASKVFPQVFFQRLQLDGAPIGAPLQITEPPSRAWISQIVWVAGGYDLFWTDEQNDAPGVYFARLSAEGERLVENTRISDPALNHGFAGARVACEGDRCGVAWPGHNGDQAEIHFAVLTSDGQHVGPETVVANDTIGAGSSAAVAFVGGAFRVVWGGGEPHPWLSMRSFSREGETIDEVTHLFQEDVGSAFHPAIASVGNRLVLTWVQSDGDLGGARRFATLGCP